MGAVPARHRLRHLRLQRHAAPRQHVRRRQLRRRRLRRVAARSSATGRSTPASSPPARRPSLAVRERAARAVQAVFAELGFPQITDAEVAGRDARALLTRPARPRPRGRCRGRRPACSTSASPALDVALRARSTRDSATSREAVFAMQRQRVVGRLPADVGGDRPRTASVRTRRQRPQRLRRAGHRLPARGRALGAPAGAAARASTRTRSASTTAPPGTAAVGDERRGRGAASARDEVVIAVGPAFGDRLRADDRRASHHGDVLAALLDGRREAGAEPRLVRVRRTSDVAPHRARRRAPVRLRRRDRAAVEGHGADPPRRPAAARQPRAVRHGAVADARLLPRRSAATPPATRSAHASARCRRARQLRAREADRAHDAAAPRRDRCGRAGRARARAQPRAALSSGGVSSSGAATDGPACGSATVVVPGSK